MDTSRDLGSATPPGGQFRIVGVFQPHVLVVVLTLVAAVYPLRGVIVAGVYLWWGSTYRAVDFVMDEARPNDGFPYIAGHLDGSTEQSNLAAAMRGETMVVKLVPSEEVVAGKRLKLWHSDTAPNMVVFGADLNDVPVAALPDRPGIVSLVLHLAMLWLVLVIGLRSAAWVGRRWSGVFNRTIAMSR